MTTSEHCIATHMADSTRLIAMDRRLAVAEHRQERTDQDISELKRNVSLLLRALWAATGFLTAIQVLFHILRK